MHIQPSGSQSKGQVGCKHFKTSLQRRVLTFPAFSLIPWYRSFWCEMHWTVGLESRIPVSHGGCSPCFLLALIHCQSALEAVWRSGKKSIFTRLIKRRYGVVRKREDKWFWFTEKPFSDTSRLLMETGRDRSRGRQQWLMQRPLTHNSCFLWIRLEKKKRKKKHPSLPCSSAAPVKVGVELGWFSNPKFLASLRLPWRSAMSLRGNALPLRWDISGQHQIPFLPACSHGGDYCLWLLLALKSIQRAQLSQAESGDRKPLPASPVCGYSAPSLHALAQ